MKKKWPWLLVAVALALLVGALRRSSSEVGKISARLVRQTFDPTGQVHLVYEVTNGTRNAIEVRTSVLEEHHERTGWWEMPDRWLTEWHIEKNAGIVQSPHQVTLHAGFTAQLEIFPVGGGGPRYFSNRSAVRGKLWHIKIERRAVRQVRSIASRLGLPPRWLMRPKPGLVDLPEAELDATALPATTAAPVATIPQRTTAPALASQASE